MADLDSDKNALETYKNLFEAADDDHSNRISYEELVEAASASDEWGHKMCREEALVMADAMFARVRELYPERESCGEDGLTFVEFVRATGASIKETTDNTDGLHKDVVDAQKARLNHTLRKVASKNTKKRRASVAKYLQEEVLAEMGPEENDDPEMARRRSSILQHIDKSSGSSSSSTTATADENTDAYVPAMSMEALSIIESHAHQLSKLEDLSLQKDQQIFDLQDTLKDKFSQIDTLKQQRKDMALEADKCQERIEELEKLLEEKDSEMLSDTQREIERLKETAQWALERQNQQLEELKRQTREAEEHRRAAASEAAAISKRMAVQHVFARAASKSKKLERQIQHKEEELKKTQAKEEKEHLRAEVEARGRELEETRAKLKSLAEDRAKLAETQRMHAELTQKHVSVKKKLDEAETRHKHEHDDLLKMQSMQAQGAEELVRLRTRIKEMETAGKEKDVALLKESAERQKKDMASWKSRIEDAENRKLELQREVERLQAEDGAKIVTLQQEKADQEKKNRALEQESAKREEALKVLQEQVDREHDECMRLKREEHEHADTKAELVEELHSAYEALNKEHLARKEELDMARAREQVTIEQLRRELAESKMKNTELEKKEAAFLKITADLASEVKTHERQFEGMGKRDEDEMSGRKNCLCSGPACMVQ